MKNNDIFAAKSKQSPSYLSAQHSLTIILRDEGPNNTNHACIPSEHEKALVFVLENMLSNIMRYSCYLHSACSMSKNWTTMMNKNDILLYVAFCTIMAISRQKEARSRDYALLIFRMTSRVIYSAQYHRQHCTLHVFEQFGALYMHNHDDKYPSRLGFEPGTPSLQAPVNTNEPSGPAK